MLIFPPKKVGRYTLISFSINLSKVMCQSCFVFVFLKFKLNHLDWKKKPKDFQLRTTLLVWRTMVKSVKGMYGRSIDDLKIVIIFFPISGHPAGPPNPRREGLSSTWSQRRPTASSTMSSSSRLTNHQLTHINSIDDTSGGGWSVDDNTSSSFSS